MGSIASGTVLTSHIFHVSIGDMKEKRTTRPYRMSARAEAAARTQRDILAATVELWRMHAIDDITLEAIAERAGVTVRTVLRRFGSKEGVISACLESDTAEIDADRSQAPVGDIDRALGVLIGHYERDGDAVLRTLALEGKVEAADSVIAAGRSSHRAWCARVFAPWLPPPGHPAYASHLDAFVAATDLYLWKLLRRDLGRSPDETRHAITLLVTGLTNLETAPE